MIYLAAPTLILCRCHPQKLVNASHLISSLKIYWVETRANLRVRELMKKLSLSIKAYLIMIDFRSLVKLTAVNILYPLTIPTTFNRSALKTHIGFRFQGKLFVARKMSHLTQTDQKFHSISSIYSKLVRKRVLFERC